MKAKDEKRIMDEWKAKQAAKDAEALKQKANEKKPAPSYQQYSDEDDDDDSGVTSSY